MSHRSGMLRCSFCRKSEYEEAVFAKAGALICRSCVGVASDIIEDARKYGPARQGGAGSRCSFCQKGGREVNQLCAGPAVYICDACVEVAFGRIGRMPSESAVRAIWRALLRRLTGWPGAGGHRRAAVGVS
jgi:ATP-dependent protease Clp ATPase subunit